MKNAKKILERKRKIIVVLVVMVLFVSVLAWYQMKKAHAYQSYNTGGNKHFKDGHLTVNINGPNGKSDSLTMYIHSDEYEKNKNIKADEPKLVVNCLLLQAKERNLFIKTKKRMKKVRAAIVGYGNIGHYVLEALQAAPDFEIAGVIRRAGAENKPEELANYAVVKDIKELGDVDVAILCTPTRSVEKYAKEYLAMGINTVDSFDIHTGIVDLRRTLDAAAKEHKAVSIISAGWDPGSDSIVRALLQAIVPKGITYTNFGPGMSMGHTVAVKAIEGVKAALSMTIPMGTGVHRRMVYIEVEEGYDFDKVAAAIKADDYFVHDETHVIQVDCVDDLKDMGHGVNLVRKGVSGKTQNQLIEFDMKINNPALTAQILVCVARASFKQQPGAYTMIELPVIDMLYGEREDLIKKLV